jgi:hypothetical protein
MSRHNLTTATFAVWIETNMFKPEEPQRDASKAVRLPVATAGTDKLIAGATSPRCVLSRDQVRGRYQRPVLGASRRSLSRRLMAAFGQFR